MDFHYSKVTSGDGSGSRRNGGGRGVQKARRCVLCAVRAAPCSKAPGIGCTAVAAVAAAAAALWQQYSICLLVYFEVLTV